jgi:pimeloyl-ACP methyl ester carboxylesterase
MIGAPVSVAAHSSGAICALGAAVRGTSFTTLVLYEPPWPVDGPQARPEQIDAVEDLVAAGHRNQALELAFREMVGLPAPAVEVMKASRVWSEWRTYVHTWPREMREVEALPHELSQLGAVTDPVLMLRGALTTGNLARAATAIAAALPSATLRELPGQGHGALGTAPELVADTILQFAPPG